MSNMTTEEPMAMPALDDTGDADLEAGEATAGDVIIADALEGATDDEEDI